MDVTLFLNHACNLACTYCYNGEKFFAPMPESYALQAVEMAFKGDRARVSFFGGEPLLEWDLMRRAMAHARKMETKTGIPLRFSMTTNGTLVKDEILATLKEERFHLVFSLDGTREAHDRTRRFAAGASSYDAITANLKEAMKLLPSLETISVIDPSTASLIPDSFEAILEMGVKNLNFSMNYEADWSDEGLEVLGHSLDRLAQIYVDLYRKGEDFSLDLFDSKVITHLKGGYACRDRCKFGNEEICVAPSGNLYPCERLVGTDERTDVTIGHIDTGVSLDAVLAMATAKNTPDDDCEVCALKQRCMFWCGCVNYATTGSVGETSGILCKMEQLAIAAADKAAGTLYKEENPMFIGKFYCAP